MDWGPLSWLCLILPPTAVHHPTHRDDCPQAELVTASSVCSHNILYPQQLQRLSSVGIICTLNTFPGLATWVLLIFASPAPKPLPDPLYSFSVCQMPGSCADTMWKLVTGAHGANILNCFTIKSGVIMFSNHRWCPQTNQYPSRTPEHGKVNPCPD